MTMTTPSNDMIKDLRERTGAGIMDCKAALKESGGNLEQAIDFLRKKGMASAAKRAGRDAKEGLVFAKLDGQKAVLVEANCETDFVARNDEFKSLISLITDETFAGKGVESDKVAQRVTDLSGKIGEKIVARRSTLVESKGGVLSSYVHSNNKLGVIVELGFTKPAPKGNAVVEELGKNLAMQIAASNPVCIRREEVPADRLEREKAIYREEIKGKPENIVEKIMQGKLDKYYQANCLIEQPFIKDDKQSVKQLIEQASKTIGDTVQINRFVRYQLGETASS